MQSSFKNNFVDFTQCPIILNKFKHQEWLKLNLIALEKVDAEKISWNGTFEQDLIPMEIWWMFMVSITHKVRNI